MDVINHRSTKNNASKKTTLTHSNHSFQWDVPVFLPYSTLLVTKKTNRSTLFSGYFWKIDSSIMTISFLKGNDDSMSTNLRLISNSNFHLPIHWITRIFKVVQQRYSTLQTLNFAKSNWTEAWIFKRTRVYFNHQIEPCLGISFNIRQGNRW